jgi:hypothetical protein
MGNKIAVGVSSLNNWNNEVIRGRASGGSCSGSLRGRV